MSPTRSDTLNEDWIKTGTWDIWLGSALVSTLAQLRQYCERQDIDLDHFLALPAAVAMPEPLRSEATLYRQERMAARLTDPTPEGKSVVDVLDEAMAATESKLFFAAAAAMAARRSRGAIPRVESDAGVRRYRRPKGTPIIARRPDLPDPNRRYPPRQGEGIASRTMAERAAADVTHTAPDKPGGSMHKGHYGTFSLDHYLDGLHDGKFASWTTAYKASWIGGDGQFDAVADHDALVGGREGAFLDGKVRTALQSYGTDHANIAFEIRGKANARQRNAMRDLADAVDAKHIIIMVGGNDRGDDEPVNGEFKFATIEEMMAFLLHPEKRPEPKTGAQEHAEHLRQFLKEDEEGETKEDGT